MRSLFGRSKPIDGLVPYMSITDLPAPELVLAPTGGTANQADPKRTTSVEIFQFSPDDTMPRTQPQSIPSGSGGSFAARAQKQAVTVNDVGLGSPVNPATAVPIKLPPLDEKLLSKQRSEYFEHAFAQRPPADTARDRVLNQSLVTAEILTNISVAHEESFMIQLSTYLASRFARPESCILVLIQPATMLLLGGSTDPAYILTISACPSMVQPTTNKRNTVLLQQTMQQLLGIEPKRAIVRFVAIPEQNLGWRAGTTVAGEIEVAAKKEAGLLPRSLPRNEGGGESGLGRVRSMSKRLNVRGSFRDLKAGLMGHGTGSGVGGDATLEERIAEAIEEEDEPPASLLGEHDSGTVRRRTGPFDDRHEEEEEGDFVPPLPRKSSRRESSGDAATNGSTDGPTPSVKSKVSRRRSFLGLFGR